MVLKFIFIVFAYYIISTASLFAVWNLVVAKLPIEGVIISPMTLNLALELSLTIAIIGGILNLILVLIKKKTD